MITPNKEQYEADVLGDPVVRDNVIVQQSLSLYHNGHVGLDVAMLLAVRCLAKQNAALVKQLTEAVEGQPRVILFPKA